MKTLWKSVRITVAFCIFFSVFYILVLWIFAQFAGPNKGNAAVAYLEQKGYLIRDRNWRRGHFELDIVAAKDNELIVVEVKTRSDTLFAAPEDAVDLPKIRRTVRAADAYIRLFQIDTPVRFDIITVVGDDGNFKVEHIEEAFYPPLY
jgi:putative endonuclease